MKKILFSHARTALKYGLISLNLKKNDIILTPGYICHVVVDSIKNSYLKHEYYRIDSNLEPDWEHIEEKLKIFPNIKGIIAVHYFGKPQNIEKFLTIKKKYNLFLIEDNAHGYYGRYDNKKFLGEYGDFSISSPRKQFNVFSGGELLIRDELYDLNVFRQLDDKRVNIDFFNFKQKLKKINLIYNTYKFFKNKKEFLDDPNMFREKNISDNLIDKYSKKIINDTNFDDIIKKRREKYLYYQNFCKNNDIKPLFDNLNQYSNPWCFPVYTKNKKERNKVISISSKNKLNLFTWPTLPEELIKNNSEYLNLWKKIICFPTM